MDISRSDGIVHRDRLLKKARQLDTPDAWKECRVQRNKTFRSIRRANSSFFHDSLQNSRHSRNLRTLWVPLKAFYSRNTKRRLYHAQPVKIANAINKFFVTVASKYQSSNDVDLQLTALKEFVRGRNSSAITFDIPEISHSAVFKHLSPLLPTKAPGPDGTCTSVTGSCSSDNRATCQNYKPMYLKESLPYFMETCKSYARVQGGRSSYCWQLQTHQHSACDVYDIRATCSSRIVRVSKPVCPAIQIPDRFQTVLLLQNCHH